ncbi:myeloperoxidase-like [Pecten maximus]|uniref:myeloperoxidase-like n=1 Tax=Pecten maximus TaxID=6579 RepID=UPI0014588B50|nr:myeloperoxidase-like [Pecten maximus]
MTSHLTIEESRDSRENVYSARHVLFNSEHKYFEYSVRTLDHWRRSEQSAEPSVKKVRTIRRTVRKEGQNSPEFFRTRGTDKYFQVMYREVLLVIGVCSLTCVHSYQENIAKSIEELIKYVHDEADKTYQENRQFRIYYVDGTIKSRRMMQMMKYSSPEVKAKEEVSMKSLYATKKLQEMTGMSLKDLKESKEIMSEWKKQTTCPTNQVDCSTASTTFRSASGTCNNLANPEYGAAATAQSRFLPPQYGDGIGSPRTQGKNSQPLPSARVVSNSVFKSSKEKKETKLSLMVMAWGQFLDHDITLTPSTSGAEGTLTHCCNSSVATLPECFPITIPNNDDHFTNSNCMEFVRSAAVTEACSPNHREQFNAITAFVDGSNVYGSSLDQMNGLRAFNKGLLKTSSVSSGLPPEGDPHSCVLNSTTEFCINTGDIRANVVPHLGANHVLFFREHNRIAEILSSMNTYWNDERVFQETRKIVSGILQQISYYEWLPSILSPSYLGKFELKKSNKDLYKPDVNPNIRNEFAVAAMRFGHSLIPPLEGYLLHDYATWEVQTPIEETFFRPSMVIGNAGQDIPKLARWMCTNSSMKVDRRFEAGVKDMLFLDSNGMSFDLAALNIQRGRDHGIPPYNAYMERFGLKKLKNFKKMTNHNDGIKDMLKAVYSHVDDIDLYVGGMTEKKKPNGNLGPTFSEIIARQFKKIKIGDRFWFERPAPEGFSPVKRKEIRKMTLAKVMCTNFGMDLITKDVFHVQSERNKLKYCDSIEEMDLTKWKA